MPTVKENMEQQGWIFEEFRCFKKVQNYEIDIEFCIGDFCVGIYDAKSLDLLEPKYRAQDFLEALIKATELEEKYEEYLKTGSPF